MFHLKELLNGANRALNSSPEVKSEDRPGRIDLLAITQSVVERNALEEIASEHRWRIRLAESCEDAIASLRRHATPIVVCDRDLRGEDWRDVLPRIALLPQPTCVLLASPVTDECLCKEVIHYHGYDILAKPFQREEVSRFVKFAWHWRGSLRHFDRPAAEAVTGNQSPRVC